MSTDVTAENAEPEPAPDDQAAELESETSSTCNAPNQIVYASKTMMDRFCQRVGLPMIDLGFTVLMKVTLALAVFGMVTLWVLLGVHAVWPNCGLPPAQGRSINAVILAIGAGLRLAAHNQPHARWKFADFLGKMLAYYGAFTLLLLLGSATS